MPRALLVALFLLPCSTALADYSPPALNDLVLTSELIVTGEIVALRADTFTLRVDETVAGSAPGPTIEVERFADWTCAARWAPYAMGQRALLFLNRHEGRWQIRSAGGEGEMPIVGDRVHVNSFYHAIAPPGSNAYAPMDVQGGRFVGFTLEARAFVAALREARACFTAEAEGPYRRITRIRSTCPGARSSAASQASAVGAALFRELGAAR